ncbi:tunicamycin resistance protein [Macrococcus equi]|uniref:tunicamycin resistance protein n=1 Tax=Macrococcus equi TaxID=3395462 RepID=UPI0039BDCC86
MSKIKTDIRIIWINGAFGVGKTTIAERLNNVLVDSLIFDPELTGSLLNKIYPEVLKQNDFQDYLEWRSINNIMLKKLIISTNKTIIVPMTIIDNKYYSEIINEISKDKIKQFLLIANDMTIINRLDKRMENEQWPYEQVNKCVTMFQNLEFGTKINTEDKSIDEVLNEIIINL